MIDPALWSGMANVWAMAVAAATPVRIWLPLAVGALVATGILFILGLRWPKRIRGERKGQVLLERALQAEAAGDLRQAACLARQASEETPGNVEIKAHLYSFYWRLALQSESLGETTDALLYLHSIPPESSLFPEVQQHLQRWIASSPTEETTGGNQDDRPQDPDEAGSDGDRTSQRLSSREESDPQEASRTG